MHFKADVSELKLALEKAKTTISNKDIRPVLRNFCLKLSGDVLSIMATDIDLATVCKINVEGISDGVITVPGMKFFQIVDLAGSDVIEFSLKGLKAVVVVGGYSADLQCLDADDFPTIAEFEEEGSFKADRALFLEYLNRISFSISENEARKNLLAVFIDAGYIQASDGHVSSVCEFDSEISDTLIPSLAVPDLVRVLKASVADFIEVASTKSFLMFRLERDLFVTRLSQAKFPDLINKILKPTESNPIKLKFQKLELEDAIKRVAVTSNASSFAVFFELNSNVVKLSSSDIDGNSSFEELSVTCGEKELNFILNWEYVLDICKSLYSDEIEFMLHDSLRVPIRIEDGAFVALLMRLSSTVKLQKLKDDTKSQGKT